MPIVKPGKNNRFGFPLRYRRIVDESDLEAMDAEDEAECTPEDPEGVTAGAKRILEEKGLFSEPVIYRVCSNEKAVRRSWPANLFESVINAWESDDYPHGCIGQIIEPYDSRMKIDYSPEKPAIGQCMGWHTLYRYITDTCGYSPDSLEGLAADIITTGERAKFLTEGERKLSEVYRLGKLSAIIELYGGEEQAKRKAAQNRMGHESGLGKTIRALLERSPNLNAGDVLHEFEAYAFGTESAISGIEEEGHLYIDVLEVGADGIKYRDEKGDEKSAASRTIENRISQARRALSPK